MARSLSTIADELNSQAASLCPRALPSLLFLTDNARTPDPLKTIEGLPGHAAVIFRHYQHPARAELALECAQLAKAKGLGFFVSEDPALAQTVDADGMHFPERAIGTAAQARKTLGNKCLTAAVHSLEALLALPDEIDAAILSPVFPTNSHKNAPSLGIQTAMDWASRSPKPVYAMGGIEASNADLLAGSKFCGIAGITLFLGDH